MKYIIKNCDLFNNFSEECLKDNGLCEFCTDCVLKQIVEKCKDMTTDSAYYAYDFAKEILDLLQIEEVS